MSVEETVNEAIAAAGMTTKSHNELVQLAWLIDGLHHWHVTGGKVGNSPMDVKVAVLSRFARLRDYGSTGAWDGTCPRGCSATCIWTDWGWRCPQCFGFVAYPKSAFTPRPRTYRYLRGPRKEHIYEVASHVRRIADGDGTHDLLPDPEGKADYLVGPAIKAPVTA